MKDKHLKTIPLGALLGTAARKQEVQIVRAGILKYLQFTAWFCYYRDCLSVLAAESPVVSL